MDSSQEALVSARYPRPWHDFVVVRFDCTGTGYVQLWLDGQLLVDARDRKIGYCGDPGMYWKQGFYRARMTRPPGFGSATRTDGHLFQTLSTITGPKADGHGLCRTPNSGSGLRRYTTRPRKVRYSQAAGRLTRPRSRIEPRRWWLRNKSSSANRYSKPIWPDHPVTRVRHVPRPLDSEVGVLVGNLVARECAFLLTSVAEDSCRRPQLVPPPVLHNTTERNRDVALHRHVSGPDEMQPVTARFGNSVQLGERRQLYQLGRARRPGRR